MTLNKSLNIALPKGRILESVLPILSEVGIKPEKSFFDRNDRKLKFKTNKLLLIYNFNALLL